ncbi:cupin domain-containing protein [Spongiibacter sp. KMU-158]|uniref:Cupin domain-containing protein n=1 Tax=Spongiibacter pelagi TaxID=2760804 RepID=A0A927C0Z0_9GAMM|nr:cupin domain-containing protein [Spongiibacter pelagi]MBD2859243.1 cupin domain-containing protein [Spongiibacter pelagi]
MALSDFDPQDFLDQYWQQRPCLLEQALPDFICPVEGDDLAGLACEAEVESRIIIEQDDDWELRCGPFSETDFTKLPAKNWTLLVQGVDQWIPEVAEIFEHFRFLPRWRTEDIMISFAVDGGNVGPHFDNYDVFLIQGAGQRRWQVGQHCDEQSSLRQHDQLRLLSNFDTQNDYLLNPGDILYIPPGVAHWGHGVGDNCITLSVGFRAPSSGELLGHWADALAAELNESQRYRDPKLVADAESAFIPDSVLNELRTHLQQKLDDDVFLRKWFGELMTATHKHSIEVYEQQGEQFSLRLGARLAYDAYYLYADGQAFSYSEHQKNAVKALCQLEGDAILAPELCQQLGETLLQELQKNAILIMDDDDY